MDEKVIDELASRLAMAKHEENKARNERIEAEEALIAQFDLGDNERKTVNTLSGLKVTMQTALNYKVTEQNDALPMKETVKRELDVKEYERLRENDPQTYARLCQYVETKPKKPSITLGVA